MERIFGCERVNFILVDRFRKVFFKIEEENDGEASKVKTYPMESSLATSAVISGHAIFTDKVKEETRFNEEIDDP